MTDGAVKHYSVRLSETLINIWVLSNIMGLGEGKLSTTATSLAILDRITDENGATLRELVDETGLAKSTVHKHLSTLCENGYLVKFGETYKLSLHTLSQGRQAIKMRPHFSTVEQRVRELANQTNTEVDFTVEENGRLIIVFESVGSSNGVNFRSGAEFHMHNAAAGKAILAEYPDERVDEILDTWGMPKKTPNTTHCREKLESELVEIKENGYAISDGEPVEGYRSVSSPIMNEDGTVLGAISAGGPTYRVEYSRLSGELAEKVAATAQSLSNDIAKTTIE
ncbi:IclR family transcriptional regulator [Natrialba magadii ATCC 43099]|uniref:IclR family transcriptional regulator n=2 Tax=Natrialba magadii (strain ATCC 43099 / DSM 3394 / CCM 3739 / CIP 104546 / IAM 13178 / JCM 8861 / NBRC 102185 / NCIMB 2190 / MS3) TaxID=547559 RepID=L9UQ83_NATMM|nr:IclR family transcriptional regulator [Natrialba magadii ATCC 43099]